METTEDPVDFGGWNSSLSKVGTAELCIDSPEDLTADGLVALGNSNSRLSVVCSIWLVAG